MVDMTRSSSVPHMAPEFEDFLFAPIGEDGHGMLLSVLSALARLNVDPWREAAKLAGLPAEKATRRLTSLIAALPDAHSVPRDAGTIAARLVTLLPRHRAGSQAPMRGMAQGAGPTTGRSRTILFVVLLILMLGARYLFSHPQPSAQVDDARPPVSVTTPVPMSPPISGR